MGTHVNNGIVTLGTSYDYDDAVREIAALLGVGKRSDGMYHLADLCQASPVNMWSRRGPFAYPSWNFASDDERNTAKASVHHGIVPYALTTDEKTALYSYIASNTSNLPAIINSSNRGWQMTSIPTGGASAPNRLRDFDGYYHLQVPTLYPIKVINGYNNSERVLKDLKSIDFFNVPEDKQYIDLVASGAEYSVAHIPLSELSDDIRNLYAGVVVARAAKVGALPPSGYVSKKTIVGDRLGDNNEFRVRIDYSDFARDYDYYILPMLFGDTSVPSTWSDMIVYLLPQEPRSLVSFLSSNLSYGVIVGTGQADSASGAGYYKFTFEITVYNHSDNGIIVDDNYIRFGIEGGLISKTVTLPDNLGLPTDNPYHTTIEVSMQTGSSTWNLPVFISLGGGQYTHEETFE